MRFNPGSFTMATESTEGTGDKWTKLLIYKRLTARLIFPVFLGDKIGLITSDKNIIFVPLPRFLSEITHLFPSKIRRWRTTQVRGEGKPDQSAILSFLEGKSWSLLS